MSGRGVLTEEIQKLTRDFLHREITTAELRLYPYLDHVLKNTQVLEPHCCNQEDRNILSVLRKEGHIEGGASGLRMTKEFYDFIQQVLWLGYVAYEGPFQA